MFAAPGVAHPSVCEQKDRRIDTQGGFFQVG